MVNHYDSFGYTYETYTYLFIWLEENAPNNYNAWTFEGALKN